MNWEKSLQKIEGFDWDEGNIGKNWSKHGITDKESEEIFVNFKQVTPDPKHSHNEARYSVLGMTLEKKVLKGSFTIRNNKIRIISSRLASHKERNLYEKAFKENPSI